MRAASRQYLIHIGAYVLVGIWHVLPSLSFDRVPPDSRTLHLTNANNIYVVTAPAQPLNGRATVTTSDWQISNQILYSNCNLFAKRSKTISQILHLKSQSYCKPQIFES